MTEREAAKLIDLAQTLDKARTTRSYTEKALGKATKDHEQSILAYIHAKARLAMTVQGIAQ